MMAEESAFSPLTIPPQKTGLPSFHALPVHLACFAPVTTPPLLSDSHGRAYPEMLLTLRQASAATGGGAQHGGAAPAQHNCL